MKKIIVAFFAVGCIFISAYGQDSSSRFSVGILAGPYFNTGADYNTGIYHSRGENRVLNMSYGAELTWYFTSPPGSQLKQEITARFLHSVNSEKRNYKGPDTYNSSFNTLSNYDESSSMIKQNYLASLGYRARFTIFKKISVLAGSDVVYISYDKTFSESKQTRTDTSGNFMSSSNNFSMTPRGYSAGVGINAGIEYQVIKGFAVGAQVTSCVLYTHFFGETRSRSAYKNNNWPEDVHTNKIPVNSHVYTISPLNYTLSARYYF